MISEYFVRLLTTEVSWPLFCTSKPKPNTSFLRFGRSDSPQLWEYGNRKPLEASSHHALEAMRPLFHNCWHRQWWLLACSIFPNMPALGPCSSRVLHVYDHIPICCPCSSTPPLTFRSSSVIRFWNISGALVMPNGKRQKHYLLKGVMKVVNLLLASSSGICQKPLVASRLEKTVASASLEVMSSKVGRTYF